MRILAYIFAVVFGFILAVKYVFGQELPFPSLQSSNSTVPGGAPNNACTYNGNDPNAVPMLCDSNGVISELPYIGNGEYGLQAGATDIQ